ncbi:sperm-associated microtubule inner protein 4 isoform X2 [Narcine bancroftii]|uniref:sperm-associated microtubule inner protein 4 isoform X2 n=1 Tax=Narcine bancroftii TaxID=1343680 RepID=UPI0038321083
MTIPENALPAAFSICNRRYAQHLENAPRISWTPWGTEREYGGIRKINPLDSNRPKTAHSILMERSHRHFGYGGYPHPSDVIIDQYYDLTQLKRSQLRSTDQLLPSTNEMAMDKEQIRLPFPAKHPFYSHISKFAVFPSFISSDDPNTGVRAGPLLPINPNVPARGHNVTVSQKTKGFPFRLEKQEIPMEAKVLQWPGQEGYFHYPKSFPEHKQIFYPTPPKTIAPNRPLRSAEHAISERTANILKNIEKSHWLNTHSREFTGSGPMNPIQLDDYFDKKMAKLRGKYSYFIELKEQSHPTLMLNSPLRPLKTKERGNEDFADVVFDYPCIDTSPTLASVPPCESIDVKSQPSMREAGSVSPKDDTTADANEAKPINWKNILCRTNTAPNICCPYSDIHMLRYKVEQKGSYEKPSGIPSTPERLMDCCETLVKNTNPSCKIRKFEQLKRPKSVQNESKYADLPQSKLLGYTSKENHMALNKPPVNDADDNEEKVQCFNKDHLASEYLQPISCPTENEELYRALQQPQIECGNILVCDESKLRISKLKFPLPFNKTLEHQKLHEIAPEKPMDYWENIYLGRKHTFFGLNSYYFHNGMLF